jgi:hypothetical protein
MGIIGVHQDLKEIESRNYPLVRPSVLVENAAQMSSIYSELSGPCGYASSFVDFLAQDTREISGRNRVELSFTATQYDLPHQDPLQRQRST